MKGLLIASISEIIGKMGPLPPSGQNKTQHTSAGQGGCSCQDITHVLPPPSQQVRF